MKYLSKKSLWMKEYIKIAFESRWLDANSWFVPMCELCGKNKAVDIDHIFWRGGKHNTDNRMYDPYNMIFLCRSCHANKWGFTWKEKAKLIAKKSIK